MQFGFHLNTVMDIWVFYSYNVVYFIFTVENSFVFTLTFDFRYFIHPARSSVSSEWGIYADRPAGHSVAKLATDRWNSAPTAAEWISVRPPSHIPANGGTEPRGPGVSADWCCPGSGARTECHAADVGQSRH